MMELSRKDRAPLGPDESPVEYREDIFPSAAIRWARRSVESPRRRRLSEQTREGGFPERGIKLEVFSYYAFLGITLSFPMTPMGFFLNETLGLSKTSPHLVSLYYTCVFCAFLLKPFFACLTDALSAATCGRQERMCVVCAAAQRRSTSPDGCARKHGRTSSPRERSFCKDGADGDIDNVDNIENSRHTEIPLVVACRRLLERLVSKVSFANYSHPTDDEAFLLPRERLLARLHVCRKMVFIAQLIEIVGYILLATFTVKLISEHPPSTSPPSHISPQSSGLRNQATHRTLCSAPQSRCVVSEASLKQYFIRGASSTIGGYGLSRELAGIHLSAVHSSTPSATPVVMQPPIPGLNTVRQEAKGEYGSLTADHHERRQVAQRSSHENTSSDDRPGRVEMTSFAVLVFLGVAAAVGECWTDTCVNGLTVVLTLHDSTASSESECRGRSPPPPGTTESANSTGRRSHAGEEGALGERAQVSSELNCNHRCSCLTEGNEAAIFPSSTAPLGSAPTQSRSCRGFFKNVLFSKPGVRSFQLEVQLCQAVSSAMGLALSAVALKFFTVRQCILATALFPSATLLLSGSMAVFYPVYLKCDTNADSCMQCYERATDEFDVSLVAGQGELPESYSCCQRCSAEGRQLAAFSQPTTQESEAERTGQCVVVLCAAADVDSNRRLLPFVEARDTRNQEASDSLDRNPTHLSSDIKWLLGSDAQPHIAPVTDAASQGDNSCSIVVADSRSNEYADGKCLFPAQLVAQKNQTVSPQSVSLNLTALGRTTSCPCTSSHVRRSPFHLRGETDGAHMPLSAASSSASPNNCDPGFRMSHTLLLLYIALYSVLPTSAVVYSSYVYSWMDIPVHVLASVRAIESVAFMLGIVFFYRLLARLRFSGSLQQANAVKRHLQSSSADSTRLEECVEPPEGFSDICTALDDDSHQALKDKAAHIHASELQTRFVPSTSAFPTSNEQRRLSHEALVQTAKVVSDGTCGQFVEPFLSVHKTSNSSQTQVGVFVRSCLVAAAAASTVTGLVRLLVVLVTKDRSSPPSTTPLAHNDILQTNLLHSTRNAASTSLCYSGPLRNLFLVVLESVVSSVCSSFGLMPLILLATHNCTPGCEAIGFSVYMFVQDLGRCASGYLTTGLCLLLNVSGTSNRWNNLWLLVLLATVLKVLPLSIAYINTKGGS